VITADNARAIACLLQDKDFYEAFDEVCLDDLLRCFPELCTKMRAALDALDESRKMFIQFFDEHFPGLTEEFLLDA